jgi:probable HAF family extracellular repeat protein
LGQAVGRIDYAQDTIPLLWDNGTATYLGHLTNTDPGSQNRFSAAYDINDVGQIVGVSYTAPSPGGFNHAFLWENGVMQDLGHLGGPSYAEAINNLGQIVGTSRIDIIPSNPENTHAVMWEDGNIIDLGNFGFDKASATEINDLGQVLIRATSNSNPSNRHVFILDDGIVTTIGIFANGAPVSMNNLGQVLFNIKPSPDYDGYQIAIWEAGNWTIIGHPNLVKTQARDINDLGQIVGDIIVQEADGNFYVHGFFWDDGTVIDLGQGEALGINNNGHIVGTCGVDTIYESHACFWSLTLTPPSPEEQINLIIDYVDSLVGTGVLNAGQGNSLSTKLDNILRHLDKDNLDAACNLLQAFINQVQSLTSDGELAQEQGQALLDAATEVSDQICS